MSSIKHSIAIIYTTQLLGTPATCSPAILKTYHIQANMGYQMTQTARRRSGRTSRVLRGVKLKSVSLGPYDTTLLARGWETLSPSQPQCFRALGINNHDGPLYISFDNTSWSVGIGAIFSGPYSATKFGPTLTPTFVVGLVGEQGICASGLRAEFFDEEVYRTEVMQFVNRLVSCKHSPLGTDAKVYLIVGPRPAAGLPDHTKTARLLEEALTYAGYGRAFRANIGRSVGVPADGSDQAETTSVTFVEGIEGDDQETTDSEEEEEEEEDGRTETSSETIAADDHHGDNTDRKPYFLFRFQVADRKWILQVDDEILAVGPKI